MKQPEEIHSGLDLQISIGAAPAFQFGPAPAQPANDLFQIHLHAAVPYEALARVLNGVLAGRRFNLSEGLAAIYIIVQSAGVSADADGHLLITVQFNGSFGGTVYLKGKPVFEAATETIRVAGMAYKLQSSSFLLQGAKWLFQNKIKTELARRTQFPLAPIFEKGKAAAQNALNREWTNGIETTGQVGDLTLEELTALPQHLRIRCSCAGKLLIRVKDFRF